MVGEFLCAKRNQCTTINYQGRFDCMALVIVTTGAACRIRTFLSPAWKETHHHRTLDDPEP